MEVSTQLQASAALLPDEQSPVPILHAMGLYGLLPLDKEKGIIIRKGENKER
jgi:hypothetical protein